MRPMMRRVSSRSRRPAPGEEPRKLGDLVSVGPATIADLSLLGIHTVEELACCEAEVLYESLCSLTGFRHDPCARDVFAAGIAQARNPALPPEEKVWWYYSRERKQRAAAGATSSPRAPVKKGRTNGGQRA